MLSAYQLSCGYVQLKEEDGVRVTLWKQHGVYHVRAHSFVDHIRLEWMVYSTLAEARKAFRDMVLKFIH